MSRRNSPRKCASPVSLSPTNTDDDDELTDIPLTRMSMEITSPPLMPAEYESNKLSPPWHSYLRLAAASILAIIGILLGTNYHLFLRHNNNSHEREVATGMSVDIPRVSGGKIPSKSSSRSSSSRNSGLALDFAIAGFPKTGTTFLHDVLSDHPEIIMPPMEFCEIHFPDGDGQAMSWLRNASSSSLALLSSKKKSSKSVAQKYGIKCPTMIRATNAIENLVKMSDRTRIVVGVRHPVIWFESFYNYRVWGHYEYNITETIPKPFDLTDGTLNWRDVSTAHARYEIYLAQLAKVAITSNELHNMLDADQYWEKRISPNPYKIFLYVVDQLHDKNLPRQRQFGRDLQNFLTLETPLVDFNQVPKANVRDSKPFKEHFDICKPRYRGLRSQLVQRGNISSSWIIDKFIKSRDVVVSNEEYFSSVLRTWGDDPCVSQLNT